MNIILIFMVIFTLEVFIRNSGIIMCDDADRVS